MKRGTALILGLYLSVFLLSVCGSEGARFFEQAGKDLEQGDNEYALEGYEQAIEAGAELPASWRGAGIANLRMGNYEEAITDFSTALGFEKLKKAMRRDILSYRATAYAKTRQYEAAMADCQELIMDGALNANTYFLTGEVALAMDAYDEAASNFDKAYAEESTYDMAIRIYQVYLNEEMEADGTRYLEEALQTEPKTVDDYCNRGRVYYYMEDYDSARQELIVASNKNSKEALLLLGMVYQAQKDISNARSMYQQYTGEMGDSAKGYNGLAQCDIAEGNYENALSEISMGLSVATTEEMQDLLYNQIVIYERQLDFTTAERLAEEYLDKFPGDEDIQRELVFLKSRTQSSQTQSDIFAVEIPGEGEDTSEDDWETYDAYDDYDDYDAYEDDD